MLNKMMNVLNVKTPEQGIEKAHTIQYDVFYYGLSTEHTAEEVFASEWFVEYEIQVDLMFQDEQELMYI